MNEISDALEALEVPLSVAEAHGLACGLLCSRPVSAAKSRWFTELLDAAGVAPDALAGRAGSVRTLDAWFAATQSALDAAGVEFEPALPDDDVALARRVDALGDFCAGFTYGIGLGSAAAGNRPLSADVRELIADFQAIDGAERGPGSGTEAGAGTRGDGGVEGGVDESDLAELVEYVRVGVLVILEELKPVSRQVIDTSGNGGGDTNGEPGTSPDARPVTH